MSEANKSGQILNSIIRTFGAALVLAVFLGVCGLGPVLLYWWIAGAVTYD